MTEFVVGFMVVVLATSIPELFVGLTSAFEGELISLPLILVLDKEMSRGNGIILLVAFSFYVWRLITQKRRFREVINHVTKKQFIRNVFLCLFSLAILMATFIASALSLSPLLIGLFMISFGTTLPELTFEIKAVIAKHRYMALGDLIGSVVANSTLVLGIVALINPIRLINFLVFFNFVFLYAFIFMTFIECEKQILWQEGIALILLYILFVIIELTVRGIV